MLPFIRVLEATDRYVVCVTMDEHGDGLMLMHYSRTGRGAPYFPRRTGSSWTSLSDGSV